MSVIQHSENKEDLLCVKTLLIGRIQAIIESKRYLSKSIYLFYPGVKLSPVTFHAPTEGLFEHQESFQQLCQGRIPSPAIVLN